MIQGELFYDTIRIFVRCKDISCMIQLELLFDTRSIVL